MGTSVGFVEGISEDKTVGNCVGNLVGYLVGFLVGILDGLPVGDIDGSKDPTALGGGLNCLDGGFVKEIDGLLLKKELGEIVSSFVGVYDRINVGPFVGTKLGLSDGTAAAHVWQHIRSTESKEQRIFESSAAAHAQDCSMLSLSGIANVSLPAASPWHAEQQLSQQFKATSGSAHLSETFQGSLFAQRQFCLLSKLSI